MIVSMQTVFGTDYDDNKVDLFVWFRIAFYSLDISQQVKVEIKEGERNKNLLNQSR